MSTYGHEGKKIMLNINSAISRKNLRNLNKNNRLRVQIYNDCKYSYRLIEREDGFLFQLSFYDPQDERGYVGSPKIFKKGEIETEIFLFALFNN